VSGAGKQVGQIGIVVGFEERTKSCKLQYSRTSTSAFDHGWYADGQDGRWKRWCRFCFCEICTDARVADQISLVE